MTSPLHSPKAQVSCPNRSDFLVGQSGSSASKHCQACHSAMRRVPHLPNFRAHICSACSCNLSCLTTKCLPAYLAQNRPTLLTKLLPRLRAQACTPSQALVQALRPVNQLAGPPDGVPTKS